MGRGKTNRKTVVLSFAKFQPYNPDRAHHAIVVEDAAVTFKGGHLVSVKGRLGRVSYGSGLDGFEKRTRKELVTVLVLERADLVPDGWRPTRETSAAITQIIQKPRANTRGEIRVHVSISLHSESARLRGVAATAQAPPLDKPRRTDATRAVPRRDAGW